MSKVCPEGTYYMKMNQDDHLCLEPRNLRGVFYNDTSGEMEEMTLPVMVFRTANNAFTESPAILPLLLLILTMLHLVRG